MSDMAPTNEQLAGMQIFPGGTTFGQAAEIMGLSKQDIGLEQPPAKDNKPSPKKESKRFSYVKDGRKITTIVYEDGTTEDIDEGAADIEDDDSSVDGVATGPDQNAFAKIKGYLSEFGLSDLEGMVSELLARGIEEEEAVIYELRNTTSFQKRFAANAARRAAGLPALTPRSYIDLENTYREVLRRGGMLEYFNRQDIFESLIGGDVSPAELYDRMTNAYQVVRDADAGTKAQMQQLYNIEEKDLAAYFLDPKTSVSMLKRRAEAAKIASIGKQQGGMQLTAQTAEDIAARGYTAAQAGTAFTNITQQAGLYETMAGEEAISEQERIGAAFGYDPMAALRLEQRKAGRKAVFQGGGQFASTRGATSGVVETGAGGPQ